MSENSLRSALELAKEIEMHCPCGARPESLNTHSHVPGCPVEALIHKLAALAATQEPQPCEYCAKGWERFEYLGYWYHKESLQSERVACERAAGAPAVSCLCKEASDGSPILDMQCPIHLEERIEALESKLAPAPRPELAPGAPTKEQLIAACERCETCGFHAIDRRTEAVRKLFTEREAPPDQRSAAASGQLTKDLSDALRIAWRESEEDSPMAHGDWTAVAEFVALWLNRRKIGEAPPDLAGLVTRWRKEARYWKRLDTSIAEARQNAFTECADELAAQLKVQR